MKGFVRRRNTTSKITDVEKLVHQAIDSITPEDWRKCVEHVRKQEKYFEEMDKKFEEYQKDEYENIQFGTLNEILATDVAAYNLQNPSMLYSVPNLFSPFENGKLQFWFDQTPRSEILLFNESTLPKLSTFLFCLKISSNYLHTV